MGTPLFFLADSASTSSYLNLVFGILVCHPGSPRGKNNGYVGESYDALYDYILVI
jgi:hypothetical protein